MTFNYEIYCGGKTYDVEWDVSVEEELEALTEIVYNERFENLNLTKEQRDKFEEGFKDFLSDLYPFSIVEKLYYNDLYDYFEDVARANFMQQTNYKEFDMKEIKEQEQIVASYLNALDGMSTEDLLKFIEAYLKDNLHNWELLNEKFNKLQRENKKQQKQIADLIEITQDQKEVYLSVNAELQCDNQRLEELLHGGY